jgi:Fe2+ transport system protein FeoA
MVKKVTELRSKESARVIRIEGGKNFKEKLNTLGIREDVKIEKMSDSFLKGPIVIKINLMEIAIGWRMANRILVQTNFLK